jgi:amino acid transporter
MSDAKEGGLRRDIGFSGSAFLAFNGIVGAGIFALPGTLYAQFGQFSPWLFPIFGVLILLIALPFARLAALFPNSGGPVAYTAVMGRTLSFEVGWLYYLARSGASAANANVFAAYAGALWPALGSGFGRIATILTLVGLLTAVNIIGVKRAIRALDALTIFKALPLIALVLWALVQAGVPAPGPAPSFSAVEAAALVILYAFVGFENAVVPAGETANPQKTIPRAVIVTLLGTVLIYFLVQLAYVAVMPPGPAPEAPLTAFAQELIGPAGVVLLAAIALASIAGNISSALTSTPRVSYALAELGSLPRWFGAVSSRYATPANSILFMGLVVATLAVSGSFVWLAVVSTLARLFVYGSSIASLPAARRAQGLSTGASTWLLAGGGLAVCLWAATQSTLFSWAMLGAAAVVGLVLYLVAGRQAASSSAATVSSIQPPPSTRSPS